MGTFGPPAVDFYSQLSGLGDTLQANAVLRQKQQVQQARQDAFSNFTALDPNSPEYGRQAITIAQKLGAVGDQDGAVKFLGLAQTAADRAHTTQREGVTDQHWNADYKLRQRSAERQDEDKLSLEKIPNSDGTTNAVAFNPRTGATKPVVLPQTGQNAGTNANLTGDEFLSTLDPGRAAQIKALVEGRSPPPGGFAMNSPKVQALVRDAAQYEPGFDLNLWKSRNSTLASSTSGKIGQNVASFNTAIGHLETLDKAIDGLNNGAYPTINQISNTVRGQVDPAFAANVTKFNIAKQAVIDELTRAFRGTGGNVHDLVQWEKSINTADSPQALKAATKQAAELLRSRVEALGDQYNRGMQTKVPRDAMDFLSPKAKSAMERFTAPSQGPGADTMLQQARDAISAGAPKEKVLQRLKDAGIDAGGL